MISVIVILGVAKFYYQDYASFFRNNKSLPHLITPSNFIVSSIKKIRHHYRDNLPYTQLGLDAKLDKPDDYRHVSILVVGETTRAQNWGLNGYLDQFLDNIISMLEKHEKWESALYYVSDHGESLGENGLYLHGAPYSIAPEYQTKVPMIMWFSKEWVKNEPFDLNCVRENAKTKTYSHDNFFHSVIGSTDVNLSLSTYRKELDILGQCRK